MSKTAAKLSENRAAGKGSLIGYFPLGFPTMEDSVEAAIAMANNGVDVLELGLPYSDPVMDGPVIQEAAETAIAAGFKIKDLFGAVSKITDAVDIPVLVMSYWNPILQYGVRDFATELKAAGGAGLITPDLIPDEAGDWLAVSDELELDRVFLAAPTSSPDRVAQASRQSRGFVYAVSTMGITGAREEVDSLAREVVSRLTTASGEQKACVGIGISTAEQVAEVNSYADGAIVGSAFVKAYQNSGLSGLASTVREIAEGKQR